MLSLSTICLFDLDRVNARAASALEALRSGARVAAKAS